VKRKLILVLVGLLFGTIVGAPMVHIASASDDSYSHGVVIVLYGDVYGTGWWAARNVLVTAAHVVEWNPTANVTLIRGEWMGSGHVVYLDQKHDVAVIRTDSMPRDAYIFPMATTVMANRRLLVIGYPYELLQVNNNNLQLTSTMPREALGWTAWYDPVYHLLEFQAETDAGNSGGPVVYENGAVVGLVSFARVGKAGVLYFASDASVIKDALQHAGVQYRTLPPPAQDLAGPYIPEANSNRALLVSVLVGALVSIAIGLVFAMAR